MMTDPMRNQPREYGNEIAQIDKLTEAGRILRGETLMITTGSHLAAVAQLVSEARAILEGAEDVSLVDWLREADKLLPASPAAR